MFHDYVNANFSAIYEQWQQTQQFYYNPNTISPSDQSAPTPMYPTIDPQTLTSIVAQMMAQTITQQPLLSLSVINLFSLLLQTTVSVIYQFKKFSDITEYNEDRDCLNT